MAVSLAERERKIVLGEVLELGKRELGEVKMTAWQGKNKTWRDNSDNTDLPISAANGGDDIPGISTWKSRHVRFIKTVSIAVVTLFIHQQIVWAQGGEAAVWSNVSAWPPPLLHTGPLYGGCSRS